MTEAEVIELIHLSEASTAQNVMNLTAIVFAYLLTAYFVGGKLPKSWATGISFCYTIFVIPVFIGCVTSHRVTVTLTSFYESTFPDGVLVHNYEAYTQVPAAAAILILLPVIIGWLGSLLYMHKYVRG